MNPPHPSHHHHRLHLHLDPRHHHHIHIHLCHHSTHLLAAAPPAHHQQQQQPGPHLLTNAHPPPYPTEVPWQPEEPLHTAGPARLQGEAAKDLEEPALQVEQGEEVFLEEDEEEPVFVLTDEWAEFFAKSEAKRRLAKQQKKNKGRRK